MTGGASVVGAPAPDLVPSAPPAGASGGSIIVPAHDEATTVGRLLDALAPLAGELEVLVVANGCTDGTAEVVSKYDWCRLVEIGVASKAAALNAGDALATSYPRVYLDADVVVDADTVRALIAVLATKTPCIASPGIRIDTAGASLPARAYQRVWALTDYRLLDHTGSGVYGVSRAGRARFGTFPDVIADDLYVRLLFAPGERVVSPGVFTLFAPRTIRAQVRRLSRTMAGELQLAERYPTIAEPRAVGGTRRRLFKRVILRPRLLPAFAVYCVTYGAGRMLTRQRRRTGRAHIWVRDDTTR